ncbi:hypothetical protein K2X33_06815 [bacterium]|nr:hypothetical protein [bacterium]
MKLRAVGIALLLSAGASGAIPVESKLSLSSGYRKGTWDTNRALATLTVRPEIGPIETTAQIWGWYNWSYRGYGTREYDVSLRASKAQYWGEHWGVSVGLQEIHWGETFGFQPIDIINTRNFRDFPFLDHGINRIPAPLAQFFYSFGAFKTEVVLNPRSEYPILPTTVRGIPVIANTPDPWLHQPEGGIKFTGYLDQANASVFVYHHINRMPILRPDFAAGGLRAAFEPVTSVGASFSSANQEWVWRGDFLMTPNHPLPSGNRKAAFAVVVGADWSPEFAEGLTLGVQAQGDGLPVDTNSENVGASFLVRKSFVNNKLQAEAQLYQSFRFMDYWMRVQLQAGLGDGWDLSVLGESSVADSRSPLSIFPQGPRVAGTLNYSF